MNFNVQDDLDESDGYKWRAERDGYAVMFWTDDRLPPSQILTLYLERADYALTKAVANG